MKKKKKDELLTPWIFIKKNAACERVYDAFHVLYARLSAYLSLVLFLSREPKCNVQITKLPLFAKAIRYKAKYSIYIYVYINSDRQLIYNFLFIYITRSREEILNKYYTFFFLQARRNIFEICERKREIEREWEKIKEKHNKLCINCWE